MWANGRSTMRTDFLPHCVVVQVKRRIRGSEIPNAQFENGSGPARESEVKPAIFFSPTTAETG